MQKNIEVQIKHFLKKKKYFQNNIISLYNEFCKDYVRCNYLSFCNIVMEYILTNKECLV